ncbi:MAG: hypothetical protein C0619_13855 [Desulfuromonas sp.]|nr:MAG: hypothetical protein C0619_13855 [Desulfuromonas sp.]
MILPRTTILIILLPFFFLGWIDCSQAANTVSLGVSVTVTSKNQCKFNTKNAALAFGDIDTFDSVDVQATASLRFICIGKDNPATFLITQDDGLYESGLNAPNMIHTVQAGVFLPYELSLSPLSGSVPKNAEQTLTVTGTVRSANYRSAMIGDYSDTVTISIFP